MPVKDIEKKLGDEKNKLLSVEQTRTRIAQDMGEHLQDLQAQQAEAINARQYAIHSELDILISGQKRERQNQHQAHEQRWQTETKARQARFNIGLKGLLDRVTGKRRRIAKQNEREAMLAAQRDSHEKDTLIFTHLGQRRTLQRRIERLKTYEQNRAPRLDRDIEQYRDIEQGRRDVFEQIRNRSHGEIEQSQSRGPALER